MADPPWPQTKGGRRKVRPKQGRDLDYPTLSLLEIMKILSKVEARVLFLWAIDKYLFAAEHIATTLGYKRHARLIWDKTNGVAPAFTVRFSHEYLLWFYKPPLLPIAKSMRGHFTTVFREKPIRHSQKPAAAYHLIESLYSTYTKLELFARNYRPGWDSWGNELTPTIQLPK